MIDLHCHLLPYVDDGARDLEEAEKLLSMEAEQGVTALCLTPHLRRGMFETPDETIRRQFERLQPIAVEKGMRLYLSREYHWDALFWEKLYDRELLPMGQNVLLTEFSPRHSARQMLAAVNSVRSEGYIPLLAHVERYPATSAALLRELRQAGAIIQANADAVLGYDGRQAKKLLRELLQAGLVDVIASDAHSSGERPPRLRECCNLLKKKLGNEPAKKLLLTNPRTIIMGNDHG